jgi:hypothetical protein
MQVQFINFLVLYLPVAASDKDFISWLADLQRIGCAMLLLYASATVLR